MALRIFIVCLLFISAVSVLIPVDNTINELEKKDLALITFNDSTMYTLDDIQVSRIVESKLAIRYKSRDEMYNGQFYIRAKNKTSGIADIISADFIKKTGANLKFVDNVEYNRDNFMNLKTNIMHYNLDTKIAYNKHPFVGSYYSDTLVGTNLYLDTTKTYFKSKKSHFEINLDNKEK